jgi:glycopeptide antibiotics resistance protein
LETHNLALITDIMMNINQFTSRFKASLDKEETLFNISRILFPTYIVFFLWVIIFKCNWIEDMLITHNAIKNMNFYQRVFNFSEIQSVLYSIKTGDIWNRGMLEPFLNIVIFIPFGLYLAFFFKERRSINTCLTSIAISFALETTQLLTMIGGFSYLDIITNSIGGVIGYYLYKLIYRKDFLLGLNIASVIMLVLLFPVAIFASVNTLINIETYIDIILRKI